MDTLLADVRSGVRMLATYPALSFVAVITLGLGIGLSTTVFCVVNGGLFKGLPFPGGDRIVSVVATTPSKQQPRQPVGAQDLGVFQARQTSYRVRLGKRQATLRTVESAGFAWGDVGGDITADGKVLYRAEVVEAGHDDAAARAALAE